MDSTLVDLTHGTSGSHHVAKQGWRANAPLLLLLIGWTCTTGLLAWHHVVWRDEVRGLTTATQGRDLLNMIRGIHGDGHPLLWYLMLRAGDALIGPVALPVIAWLVAFAAAALLALRAPFSFETKALVLASHFALWEYAVIARNYGISMLIMFAFAALYRGWRQSGAWLALPLVLLTQTNMHSMLIAWLLLGAWLADVLPPRAQWTGWALRVALPAVLLVGLGSLACFFTVWPPINDAAQVKPDFSPAHILAAFLLPGRAFLGGETGLAVGIGYSVMLFAALLTLWKRPLLLLAGLGGLWLMSLFFTLVYPGGERHKALWLVLVLVLAWIRSEPMPVVSAPSAWHPFPQVSAERLERIGHFALCALLVTQVMMSVFTLVDRGKAPFSRSHDAARVIARTPGLAGAIVISDPDFMIEPLPYYAPDLRFWRLRQGGFSAVNVFTSHGAHLNITLDDVTATARNLALCYDRPVAILLANPPRPGEDDKIASGYNWSTRITPPMVSRFEASTRLLAALPPAMTDESYTIYALRHETMQPPAPVEKAAACKWLAAFPLAGSGSGR